MPLVSGLVPTLVCNVDSFVNQTWFFLIFEKNDLGIPSVDGFQTFRRALFQLYWDQL